MFSLESWLIDNKEPKIMPAVYNFYQVLGKSAHHSFTSIIFHPSVDKEITFQNGSKILIKKLSVPFHYVRKFVSMQAMKNEALRMLDQSSYDVVYGMTIYANIARVVGKQKNVPSVARLFGSLIWDTMQKGDTLKLHTRFRYQYLEAKKPCDILICTEDGTEFDKALAKISPEKKVHMLYNGIQADFRKRLMGLPLVKNMPADMKIISIGRLTSWKRHDMAIQVVKYLVQDHNCNSISLTILGKGEEKENLDQMIKAEGLSEYINLQDPIPHAELPSYLEKFHVGLFLYDASNLGNAMWEAALGGRFICTRPTGKTGKIFREGENSIVGNSANEIAGKLYALLGREVSQVTAQSRQDIDTLLPTWKERIEKEMKIISDEIT